VCISRTSTSASETSSARGRLPITKDGGEYGKVHGKVRVRPGSGKHSDKTPTIKHRGDSSVGHFNLASDALANFLPIRR
jgi:hypothetical protein